MASQYSDMRCRTCASNFAAETTPKDIETLISIILPIKRYRCRGCYTRSWHIDRQILRLPRVLFWIPFWTFFIYGLVKGITNEPYEIVQADQAGNAQIVIEDAEPSPQDRTAQTPVRSFGEILSSADSNRLPVSPVANTNTTDAPPQLVLPVETPEVPNMPETPEAPEQQLAEEVAPDADPVDSQANTATVSNVPSSGDDLASDETGDLAQFGQTESIAVAQPETVVKPPFVITPVEPVNNSENIPRLQTSPEEQPLVNLDAEDQNIEDFPTDNQNSNSALVINTNNGVGNREHLWLFEQAAELFTLQIGSFKTIETAQTAASVLKLSLDPLLKYQQSGDGNWQYLLYGTYKTSELAKTAAETLGLKDPWIRKFRDLQRNRCKAVEANTAEAIYCNS